MPAEWAHTIHYMKHNLQQTEDDLKHVDKQLYHLKRELQQLEKRLKHLDIAALTGKPVVDYKRK